MGNAYCFKCTCGYERELYLGVGFCYPEIYDGIMKAAKSGMFGAKYERLLKKHPDAAIDPSLVLTRCKKCNSLESEQRLSLHLPNPGYDRSKQPKVRWSSFKPYFNIDYVSPGDLRDNYSLLMEYKHFCHKCGGALELVEESEIGRSKLKCPMCCGHLEILQNLMWD